MDAKMARTAENQMSLDALQKHVDTRLTAQDKVQETQSLLLRDITTKLDGHIEFAKARFEKVEPVVDAMETMQTGIKVIGWIGTKATAVAVMITAIVGAILAWKGWRP